MRRQSAERYELTVEGMSCTGCEAAVSNAIRRVDGVHRVEADPRTGQVTVTIHEGIEPTVRQAIHEAGYDVPA